MTYEEALARLLQIAGDYNEVYNTRALNEAIARKELEQINVEIKKLVEDLSPSPDFLNITLDSCGYPMILSSRGNITFYNWIYGIMGEDKEEAIRSYFERLLLAFLKNYAITDLVNNGGIYKNDFKSYSLQGKMFGKEYKKKAKQRYGRFTNQKRRRY